MPPKRDTAKFIDSFRSLKRLVSTLAQEAWSATELGENQVRVLRQLGRTPRVSQAEISRETRTDPALTGRAVEGLLERGYIVRERSEEDRRGYLLDVSPAGRRVVKRIEELRAALVEKIAAPLDAKDLDDFERIVGKLVAEFGKPE